MKWLITGGCGFIGSSLIRILQAQGGHYIRVLDNLSTGTRADLSLVADFAEKSTAGLKWRGKWSWWWAIFWTKP